MSETWIKTPENGLPMRRYLPDAIPGTGYVRDTVRRALAMPEDQRANYWKCRRSHAARKLWDAGFTEEEVERHVRHFAARVRRESHIRKLLNRIEAAVALDEAIGDDDEQ